MPIKAAHAAELPNPLDLNDLARIEELFRIAGVVKGLIERCKRCKIPVDAVDADCDAACSFLESVYSEYKGPQSPVP